ncbi:MAG: lactate permease LctP family transporter [Bacillota bacterium]|jgi:L-lactate transport|nr:L-lactate permease [Bacillota bacterium]
MAWNQVYAPVGGNLWLSVFVALLPIVFFFYALAVRRMPGHKAGLITVALTVLIAVFVYRMPVSMALAATGYGIAYGLWPIAWIIVTAVFLYKITVKSGQFAIIRSSVVAITEDQRLQAILVSFCFGAFLEGAAGFGTPVAITAALLAGLGFHPLYAAGLCLIANTAPVAWGGVGIPITVAGSVSGIDPMLISQMAGRQLPLLSILVPFWLVAIMDGWRGIRETWPATLVAGLSFAAAQYVTANFISHELPDITSALVSLAVTAGFLKVWRPAYIFRFVQGRPVHIPARESGHREAAATAGGTGYTLGQAVKAWSPFLLLTVVIGIWSLKPVKDVLSSFTIQVPVPFLHNGVQKVPPVVETVTPYAAEFKFDWIGATGTAIFVTALLTKFLIRMPWRDWFKLFGETVCELSRPIVTVGAVLGFAYIANYSGQSATLGLALAATGSLFPFFSPVLGWLGVFLTGSDTSSNALFGNLQKVTGERIGIDPTLFVAANTTGGVTGKMISPQSVAVACAAVGLVGKESDLFRFTLKHSLLLLLVLCVLTALQAYGMPWMIPGGH